MKIDLSKKRILVTGASRGIGRALAIGLAGAGARVVVHYNRQRARAEELAAQLEGAIALQANIEDPQACTALFEKAIDVFGGIDVLVNNAAISLEIPMDAPLERWLPDWERTIAVNLTATQLLSRLAIHHFLSKDGGRIINIASRAAFRGDTPEFMAYAASKGGMIALTRSIARGFGKKGIKAFAIAPGFTRTEMAQDFIDVYGEEYVVGDLALDRMTEPEDIAPTVVLLASGLADHATGTTIDINAGSYVH